MDVPICQVRPRPGVPRALRACGQRTTRERPSLRPSAGKKRLQPRGRESKRGSLHPQISEVPIRVTRCSLPINRVLRWAVSMTLQRVASLTFWPGRLRMHFRPSSSGFKSSRRGWMQTDHMKKCLMLPAQMANPSIRTRIAAVTMAPRLIFPTAVLIKRWAHQNSKRYGAIPNLILPNAHFIT